MKKRTIVLIIGWAVALSAFSVKIPARAISIDDSGFTQADVETLQKFTEWAEGEVSSWANPTNGLTQAQADLLYFGVADTDGVTISTNASGKIEVISIPTNTVDTAELVDLSVTTAKIAGATVTFTKLSGVKDEDDMVSDSALALATQQSIKAYADGSSLLSANGWSVLPSGLMMQWWTDNPGVLANTSFTSSFPTNFPTATLQVIIGSTRGSVSGNASFEGTDVTSFTTTNVLCATQWEHFSANVRFFAIGY